MRRGGGGSNRSVSGIHQSQYHQQQSQPSFAHGLASGSHHRVYQANAAAAAAAAASVNVTFDRRISEADAYLVLLLEQQQAFEARYKTLRMQTDAEAKRGKTGILLSLFCT